MWLSYWCVWKALSSFNRQEVLKLKLEEVEVHVEGH